MEGSEKAGRRSREEEGEGEGWRGARRRGGGVERKRGSGRRVEGSEKAGWRSREEEGEGEKGGGEREGGVEE